MSNIAKPLRAMLEKHFTLDRPELVEEQSSEDGTRKWLFRFPPRGAGKPVEVETVYIPEGDRGTLCISSQVGCTLTCTFCHTGTQKLVRNLTSEEILMQLIVARDRLGDFPDKDAEGQGLEEVCLHCCQDATRAALLLHEAEAKLGIVVEDEALVLPACREGAVRRSKDEHPQAGRELKTEWPASLPEHVGADSVPLH